jgi:hypothetical protein
MMSAFNRTSSTGSSEAGVDDVMEPGDVYPEERRMPSPVIRPRVPVNDRFRAVFHRLACDAATLV